MVPFPCHLPSHLPHCSGQREKRSSGSTAGDRSVDHERDEISHAGGRPTVSTRPIVSRSVEQRAMEGQSQLNPDAIPFIPSSGSLFSCKVSKGKEESSSVGDPSGRTFDPSLYEENDMDPLALTKYVLLMFPNISDEFIYELLLANEFDINLTVDMLHELSSQNIRDDNVKIGLPTFPYVKNLHGNLGLPDGDDHLADMSQINKSLDQALQKDKSVSTSGAKAVLPMIPDNDLLDNYLGLPEDDTPAITSTAN